MVAADLPEPRCSEPGYRRPVLVVQADSFNLSRIQTAIVAAITSNLELAGTSRQIEADQLVGRYLLKTEFGASGARHPVVAENAEKRGDSQHR